MSTVILAVHFSSFENDKGIPPPQHWHFSSLSIFIIFSLSSAKSIRVDRGSTSKRRCATYNKGITHQIGHLGSKKRKKQRKKIYKYSAVDLRLNVSIRRVVVVVAAQQ